MAKLQANIQVKIDAIVNESNELFQNGKHKESTILLEEAWSLIPEPKGIYSESYHIVKDIVDTCILLKDFNKAYEWSKNIFITGFMRFDTGDKEFISAKAAYALGEFDLAKEFFSFAFKKSEGRCFEGKDPKYLEFFKN
ncbi:hypothetical protein [Paenibacillus sp. AD87]|uniref:hypothetical protein n=1 Tax=Paenibacillus sp. AD87 TaxID=1528787 RepID=UPI0007E31D8A|nr:hypothetical protein [Paenibacillus sp. AD87]OAX47222.1 hypothetical protein gpAD87_03615 [Paenibacillus sp. AD87]